MNGPVVTAARQALETGNINMVLVWVQSGDEAIIREAFAKTLAVRNLSPEAKKLADTYFFETVVRIHRAGEGVAYTGLKPAETEIDPGIHAADQAIDTGTADELLRHTTDAVHDGLHMLFSDAMAKRSYDVNDVAAGRRYVAAYVRFIHYAEAILKTASHGMQGHPHDVGGEAPPAERH